MKRVLMGFILALVLVLLSALPAVSAPIVMRSSRGFSVSGHGIYGTLLSGTAPIGDFLGAGVSVTYTGSSPLAWACMGVDLSVSSESSQLCQYGAAFFWNIIGFSYSVGFKNDEFDMWLGLCACIRFGDSVVFYPYVENDLYAGLAWGETINAYGAQLQVDIGPNFFVYADAGLVSCVGDYLDPYTFLAVEGGLGYRF